MTYICIECGAEVDHEYIIEHRMKCTHCKEKRSNIWVKKRPQVVKTLIAR